MFTFLHKYASLMHFYRLSTRWSSVLALVTAVLMAWGLYGGLVTAPADYQQGDSFRIIYIHVPSAWMSLFVYMCMAGAGAVALIWRIKLAEIWLRASAPLGASFTFLALVTGAIWGKPMWGTW
ncbi:MAG: cytochrome c biogenesis protein CcsA, partial [Gammaproteobacteria bacterium]